MRGSSGWPGDGGWQRAGVWRTAAQHRRSPRGCRWPRKPSGGKWDRFQANYIKKCTFQTQLKVRGYLLQVLVDGDVSHGGLLTQQLSEPEEKNQFNFTSVFTVIHVMKQTHVMISKLHSLAAWRLNFNFSTVRVTTAHHCPLSHQPSASSFTTSKTLPWGLPLLHIQQSFLIYFHHDWPLALLVSFPLTHLHTHFI